MSARPQRDPSPGSPLRVAVVNDYPVVAAGVRALLSPWTDRVEVVGLRQQPDLVLYDTFGRLQGAALQVGEVLSRTSAARLVVYSWNASVRLARESMDAGATGYAFKGLGGEELVQLLEQAHRGEQVVALGPPRTRPPAGAEWPGRPEGLSVREAEIIALITQGLTNVDIAERSHLSINSVKTYIRTAYRKMGVERRPQAVLWGVQHGFVTSPDHSVGE